MGFMSHRIERSDLKAGDHIYTYRAAYTYSHHGIYVYEGRVVHFTQYQNWSSSVTSTSSRCFSSAFCGSRKAKNGVTMSCLDCFLRNGSLRRYEYGAARFSFIAKRGGTCTTAKSDDLEAVIYRAMYLLYNGFGKYNLFRNNCEDFALYCKTGLLVDTGVGGSGQASSTIASLVRKLGLGTEETTVGRSNGDIGHRSDMVKVQVENVEAFFKNQCAY